MFLCLLVINGSYALFPTVLKGDYTITLGMLTSLISLFVGFRSFTVKAAPIATPFKIFGVGVGLFTLPKFIILILWDPSGEPLFSSLQQIGGFICFVAICMALKRTINFIKQNADQPAEVTK